MGKHIMRSVAIALLIAIIGAVVISATGCGPTVTYDADAATLDGGRVQLVERKFPLSVYMDTETGVCYLAIKDAEGNAICVMVNQDGSPYVANGWRDYD